MRTLFNKLTIITIFAIAMGFLEAVVVVYLREIYYPNGFEFPLSLIDPEIFKIELVREITTLVMLVCIGLLSSEKRQGKFAGFLFAFGVWDIFYYLGLKIFLNWPESFLTWDILFLIPTTWLGPVLAPLICSVTMILLGLLVIWFEAKGPIVKFGASAWVFLIVGSFLVFLSFIEDYSLMLLDYGIFSADINHPEQGFIEVIASFVPDKFNWLLFGLGELLILTSIFFIFKANHKSLHSLKNK